MTLTKPLVFFDIEATGTDVATDRIVSIALLKCNPDKTQERMKHIVNPGIPIKPEASKVNGFEDEDVADMPSFKFWAKTIHEFVAGCDLAGFNLLNFDIPMLWEEFHRSGIAWDLTGTLVVDAGNIFKKMEERTLTAAVKFYCGRDIKDAHDAMADADSTADVFRAQLKHYPELMAMELPAIAEFCKMDNRVDLAGKIVLNEQGEAVYNFGKPKGKRVVDDIGFGRWMLDKDFSENTKQVVRKLLEG